MNQDWLDNECQEIEKESKKKTKLDNFYLIKFIFFIIPILAFNTLSAKNCYKIQASNSAQWHCKACKRYVYSENPDYFGRFYCPRC